MTTDAGAPGASEAHSLATLGSTPRPATPPVRQDLAFGDEIRPWPVPGLLADAQRAIAAIPDGANNVLMGYVEQSGGQTRAGLVAMKKLGAGWSAVLRGDWAPKQPLSASVVVVKAWE